MATLHRNLVDAAEGVKFASRQIDTRMLFQGPQFEIQDNVDIIPEFVVVREIDMAPPGSVYPFVFKKPDRRHAFTQQDFPVIIQKLLDGTYRPNGMVNQYYRPLDVQLPAPTCFVFRLTDRWCWRFSTQQDGITLGESDPFVQQRYANLLHFIDAKGQSDPFGHNEFCRTLCFTAIPELDATGNVIPFNHRFNIIVEFVYPDGDEPNRENVIPVLIDPDVRHPGGSSG